MYYVQEIGWQFTVLSFPRDVFLFYYLLSLNWYHLDFSYIYGIETHQGNCLFTSLNFVQFSS